MRFKWWLFLQKVARNMKQSRRSISENYIMLKPDSTLLVSLLRYFMIPKQNKLVSSN